MNCFLTAWDREGRGSQRESPWRPPRGGTGEALGKEEKLTIYARLNTGTPRLFFLWVLFLLGAVGPTAPAAAAEAPDSAPAAPLLEGWTRLTIEGRKFLVARGRSVIERRQAPAAGEADPGPVAEVRVVSTARVLGHDLSRHHVVSRARVDGRLIEWVERDGRGRLRRGRLVGDRLVVSRFSRRASVETGAWTLDRRRVFPLAGAWERVPAIDPYGLLGRLATAAAGSTGRIFLLTRRGPVEVVYRAEASVRERWRLRDEDAGRSRRYALRVRRVDLAPARQGGRTLFDMEGPLQLWVEEGWGRC
ncbi:MAG: hypothetical protein Q9Q13_00415 [Acidobacteriota bacterium]|nr:hypothetical protein [Acidobacteriota bacterium]